MESQAPKIIEALKDKASLKQGIYQSTKAVFEQMKQIAEKLSKSLAETFSTVDSRVIIEYRDINEFEFQLKFSGDVLMFTMHTNVTTLLDEHIVLKSPYVMEDTHRGYFGSVMVYNYMADSVKYNRLQDLGYLVARMMLNKDGHFYIEGVRQLNFLHPDIAQNKVTPQLLQTFIESTMLLAIEQDLVAPNYQDIMVAPLGAKLANQGLNTGSKVGFASVAMGRPQAKAE